jgi:hypothetical protein
MAGSLPQAAGLAADNLYTLWVANTLKSKSTAFWQALATIFPEAETKSHGISNWLILIADLADLMPSTSVSYSDLDTMTDYVYRICYLASALVTQSPNQITGVQAQAVLDTYNAQFA